MAVFSDFVKVTDVKKETIESYVDVLPKELLNFWQEFGYGTFMNGYLKTINPDDYFSLVDGTYLRSKGTIPILTTAMGDVILIERDKDDNDFYVVQLNYRKGISRVIASKYTLFLRFLEELPFKERALDWNPYPIAVVKYGKPSYDECFGYTPLLGLGGSEKVENLQKVKLKEHILIITEFMGPIE